MPPAGRDTEEKQEQWLTFQEPIAVTSAVQMPRPSPAGSAPSANLSLLSPIKIDNTTSVEALKVLTPSNGCFFFTFVASVILQEKNCVGCKKIFCMATDRAEFGAECDQDGTQRPSHRSEGKTGKSYISLRPDLEMLCFRSRQGCR